MGERGAKGRGRKLKREEKREGRVKGREGEAERRGEGDERETQRKMHSQNNTITTTSSTYMLMPTVEFPLTGDLGPLNLSGGGPLCDLRGGDV